jgi:cobalamin synthase
MASFKVHLNERFKADTRYPVRHRTRFSTGFDRELVGLAVAGILAGGIAVAVARLLLW